MADTTIEFDGDFFSEAEMHAIAAKTLEMIQPHIAAFRELLQQNGLLTCKEAIANFASGLYQQVWLDVARTARRP